MFALVSRCARAKIQLCRCCSGKKVSLPTQVYEARQEWWVAQVRQKFWLRAVLFLFVVTQSETLIHEQPKRMCVLEDSKLHHCFECHVVGRLLHDCVVSTRATPSVLTHLDPKSDLTIRFLSRRSRCSELLFSQNWLPKLGTVTF